MGPVLDSAAAATWRFRGDEIARRRYAAEACFLHLEAPPARVCGLDTPFPLVHEKSYLPTEDKVLAAIYGLVDF